MGKKNRRLKPYLTAAARIGDASRTDAPQRNVSQMNVSQMRPLPMVEAQMFESAEPPRRLQTFFADATDEYADTITQESVRQEMRANSRKVFLNEGCTNHGAFTMGIHTVGDDGPACSIIPEKQKGRQGSDPLAPEISKEEREHIEWMWYHFSQDIDLAEHLRIAVESLQYDGEIFFQMVSDPEIEGNLNLEQIEAKRVMDPYQGAWREDIVGGILYGGMHPKAYFIRPKTINPTLDFNWTSLQVPASEILHFSVMRLPDQHRGLPWMQSVLNDIAETQLYESYHLGAANAAARNSGGVVECSADAAAGQNFKLQPTYTSPNPGEIKQLIPGLTYKQGSANWPTSNYAPFLESKREKHAAGMQMTKAMLTNNFEKHSYSSFRGEMIVYWEIIKFLRGRLKAQILNQLFNRWLMHAAASDDVILDVLDRYNYRYSRIPRSWTWPPIPAYDLSDFIGALAEAVSNGFLSRKMACAMLGYDFEQVETDRKEDDFSADKSSGDAPINGQNL